MTHDWDRLVGHPLPVDFPFELLIGLHDVVRQRTDSPNWDFFAGAENGIAYRAMAMARADDSFSASANRLYTPAERAEQELSLFSFFTSTISAVETLFFAVYAAAAVFDPMAFEHLPTAPRAVVPKNVATAFRNLASALPMPLAGDSRAVDLVNVARKLSDSLDGLLNDGAYGECLEIRNILSHRAAPGRHLDGSGSPMVWKLGAHGTMNDVIGPRLTESRRGWYMASASQVLRDAVGFLRAWPASQVEAEHAEQTGGIGY